MSLQGWEHESEKLQATTKKTLHFLGTMGYPYGREGMDHIDHIFKSFFNNCALHSQIHRHTYKHTHTLSLSLSPSLTRGATSMQFPKHGNVVTT